MAKKKPRAASRTPRGSAARKRTIKCEQVKRAASLLAERSAELEALAALMTSDSSEIDIDGFGLWDRGVGEINRFIANIERGVNRARRERKSSSL